MSGTWKHQMNQFIVSVKRQTRASLLDFVESGLKTDEKFQEHLMNVAFNSIKETCKEFERELQWNELSRIVENNSNGQENSNSAEKDRWKRKADEAVQNGAKKFKMTETTDSEESSAESNESQPYDRQQAAKMRFGCLYCKFGGNSVYEVYHHWQKAHTGLIIYTPFLFFPIEIARCFYCSTIGTYRSLLKHTRSKHSEQILVITDQHDRNACGICHQAAPNVYEHFRHEHAEQSDLMDPIWLTDQSLHQLLCIDVQPNEHINSHEYAEKPIANQMYTICGCCQTKVATHLFFDHIQNHSFNVRCAACDFHADTLNEMVIHEKVTHSADTLSERCAEYSEWLVKQFVNTKIVFENGLVLSNHNLYGTKYDNVRNFAENVVEQLVQSQRELCETSLATQSKSVPPTPSEAEIELNKQNELRKNIFICGIPMQADENLLNYMLKLTKFLNVPFSKDDIEQICRTKGHAPAIFVCFKSYELKELIVKAANNTRLYTSDVTELTGNQEPTTFYVNRHMTIYYRRMWDLACKMKKIGLIHSINLTEQGISIRRTKNSIDQTFVTEKDLLDLSDSLKHGIF